MKKTLQVEGPWREALRMFARNPSAIAGMLMLGLVLLVSLGGPWLMGADPIEIRAAPMTPPFSEDAVLGTDVIEGNFTDGLESGAESDESAES